MKKTSIFYIVAASAIAIAAGTYFFVKAQSGFPNGQKRSGIMVTTSVYPLYFFTSAIGGEKVDVKNITPAGAEPHDFEPTAQDLIRMQESELVVINGAGLEAWEAKVKDNLAGGKTYIITASDGLATTSVKEGEKMIVDPHVWLDPLLAKQEAGKILNALVRVSPRDRAYFEGNAKRLFTGLDALDSEYRQGLMSCNRKDFITSHAAFGYLAKAYGLEQVTITGISPDEEPSAKRLAEIAGFAKKNHIGIIFFEKLLNPKLSETVAHEVGAQTLVLDPIEGVSDTDMRMGKTYFSIMRANLINLQKALGCR